jgi:hypothetical protein
MNRRVIQWHSLFWVILCAAPALQADVCSGLPDGPPNGVS